MNTFALPLAPAFRLTVHMSRLKTVLMHLGAWLPYYLFECVFQLTAGGTLPDIRETLLQFSVFAFLVYVNSEWLFPRLFIPKRYGAYALSVVGLFLVFLALRISVAAIILPWLGVKPMYSHENMPLFLSMATWRGVQFYMYSLVYAYFKHSITTQQQLREQERGLLEADIALLKSQINPHFLFNALNFLYAQVYPLSEPTAKSVLLLSDIMRYALHEGGEQGKVMLDKEIQHLRNYLAINQLRFGHKLQVQLQVQGNTQFLLIMPLVLITFVENCFKHGELFDPAHPVLVQVRVQENQLTFFASNRKHGGPVEQSTGIGLENTRRRLQAIYPGRHRLTVNDTPDSYAIHLSMSL
jgi:sensor histidine kinase YesM